MSKSVTRDPTLLQSLIPVALLIVMLWASVRLFGDGSSSGPNQMALLLAAAAAVLVGMWNGHKWDDLQEGMIQGVSISMGAIFILFTVGSLIGTWIMAGIVPAMIYYGLLLLHPSIFYLATVLICAVVSIATGSSWTTAGTVGVALIGIAGALDVSLAIAAGAVISGSYFGDKLSPLSDTTNLAPAMTGTDLFTHIRHLLWTTIPALVIACILFLILGLRDVGAEGGDLQPFMDSLSGQFDMGWHLMIPPAIVLFMVAKRVPALPALLAGALIGGVFAVVFQQDAVLRFVDSPELARPVALLKGFWISLFDGFSSDTGNERLDDLLTRGGMSSMLTTVWLILTAMIFGSVMERTGKLSRIAATILASAQSTGSLIFATIVTAIGTNIVASDQYISIVLPGRMFRAEFEKRKLHPKNLSRCLEDAGTMTSSLVPWNTGGAYMAGTLGVPTLAYLPFCFVNLLSPVISAIYGFTGFTIEKLEESPPPADLAARQFASND